MKLKEAIQRLDNAEIVLSNLNRAVDAADSVVEVDSHTMELVIDIVLEYIEMMNEKEVR